MSDPTIEDWYVYPAPGGNVLVGRVKGHPTVPDGPITTSAVVEIGDGWARTMNRSYRLGQPHGARRTFLDELIATTPAAEQTPFDVDATIATWEDYPGLPPWRP
jgi:hypothetical protein